MHVQCCFFCQWVAVFGTGMLQSCLQKFWRCTAVQPWLERKKIVISDDTLSILVLFSQIITISLNYEAKENAEHT